MSGRERTQTPRELVLSAEQRFEKARLHYGHGTDNARDEAVYLVLGALGIPFRARSGRIDRPLSGREHRRILGLIERRIDERIPVAYLVNRAWFAGLPFYVDERVLVPRSPIAELIEDRFRPWIDPGRVRRILDIGAGCGAIAVGCAVAFPGAGVDAVDISRGALEITRRNARQHRVARRVRWILSDVYEAVPAAAYDLIVANPPYVSAAEYRALPQEYRHEPRAGLEGGADGLAVVARILAGAARRLNPRGILVMEVGSSAQALVERYPQSPFTWLEFERGGEGVCLLSKKELETGLS
ncbi:MAG: 50S ribosomal protein L3 N(5)-glutamine methyltransferase [Gammaproteobacteria bacterium]|nr:50S ribosomal protein L3 N(5)-glutamine methyltransferase [Gammaproteobacteria bacterium]